MHLEKNQPVLGAPGYFVAVAGDYSHEELIPCSHEEDGEAICAFLLTTILGE